MSDILRGKREEADRLLRYINDYTHCNDLLEKNKNDPKISKFLTGMKEYNKRVIDKVYTLIYGEEKPAETKPTKP